MKNRTDSFGGKCAEAGVGDDLPVVCVDWLEAVRFCNELSRLEGLELAYEIQDEEVRWNRAALGYRLPTEAEWEYTARAGTRFTWVGTDDVDEVCEYANIADASAKEEAQVREPFACDDSFVALAPVKARKTNRWLFFGLGGNSAEWVWDAYGPYPRNADDQPNIDGERDSDRVIRGGSWRSNPRFARVAYRGWFEPSWRDVLDSLGDEGLEDSRCNVPSQGGTKSVLSCYEMMVWRAQRRLATDQ